MMFCHYIIIIMIVFSSQGLYGFPPLRTIIQLQFLNYWPYVYWNKAMNTMNPFQQPRIKVGEFGNYNNIVCLHSWPQESTYCLSCWAYDLRSFPAQTYFCPHRPLPISFVSSKSAFLCSLINTRVPVVTYMHAKN